MIIYHLQWASLNPDNNACSFHGDDKPGSVFILLIVLLSVVFPLPQCNGAVNTESNNRQSVIERLVKPGNTSEAQMEGLYQCVTSGGRHFVQMHECLPDFSQNLYFKYFRLCKTFYSSYESSYFQKAPEGTFTLKKYIFLVNIGKYKRFLFVKLLVTCGNCPGV